MIVRNKVGTANLRSKRAPGGDTIGKRTMNRFAAALAFAAVALPADRQPVVATYCQSCHNPKTRAGSLDLVDVDPNDPTGRAMVWEKAVRKIKAGEMPPAGAPTPGSAALRSFADAIERDLDAAAARAPKPGRAAIRRLNRTEYANAVRDLLAIELPPNAGLPQDGIAAGFDNIADALTMSPLLLERYLKVARRVSELAAGTAEPSLVTEVYPATGTQAVWREGMPFGTRGGIRAQHHFPHDGEYQLRAFLAKENLTPTEGVRFFRAPITVTAGAHSVIVTFPDEFAAREGPVSDVAGPGGDALGGPLDLLGKAIRPTLEFRVDGRRVKLFEIGGMSAGEAAFDGQPGPPTLTRIEIAGPIRATGAGDTPSMRRIFLCKPPAASEESSCAARILTALTRRAFRRDTGASDIKPFLATFHATRRTQSFEASIAAAVRDILLAPDFLFRLEFDPAGAAPGSVHSVSGFELASRLSFFLWSTIPDDKLLDAASKLDGPALDVEIRRMLADPRSSALAGNFAAQWLGLRGLDGVEPDKQLFPEFDPALAAAFRTETGMFVGAAIRDNRGIPELIGADYTYLNERLARLYGIDGVVGPGFRRVPLPPGSRRGGLLTQGSVLLLTSHQARTSPVLRGKWILDNLLNSPPPPPPANVPPLEENPAAGRKLTTRERVERHRSNPACASCHSRIDALGFALENFDPIGRWRTHDDGSPIDSSGKLPNGKTFQGPDGLKNLLLDNPEEFARGAVERLMTYALGRELEARDQPAVRQILRGAAPGGYRFHDVVAGIVKSVPFRMRETRDR